MVKTKTCRRCWGELPADEDHFYRQDGGDGWSARCRDCIKTANRERKAALRAQRKREPPLKRCLGACGRELPSDAVNFARDPLDRPRPRCRQCELAAELAAAIEHPNRSPSPSPEPSRVVVSSGPPALGFSRPGSQARLNLLRRRVDGALTGKAATAERARRIMRAADAALAAAIKPPFDANELLLDMAENAEDVHALGATLRAQGWKP